MIRITAKTKRNIAYLMSLALLFALFALPTHAGSTANNDDEIAKLQARAAQIARENQERADRIANLQGDVAREDAYIREVNKQIKQIGAQIDAYIELIDAKQRSIDGIVDEIETKGREISETEQDITRRENEIERLDKENNENIKLFGQTLAQMYMNSGGDVFGLLSGATSFYDILVRTEMIRNIGEKNTELLENLLDAIKRQETAIADLQQEIVRLEADKVVFEQRQKGFEDEKAQLEIERQEIAKDIDQQYATLKKLTSGRDDLQFNIRNLEGQINTASSEVNDIQKRIAELEEMNRQIEAELRGIHQANPDRPSFNSEGFIWPLDNRFRRITCGFGCFTTPCAYCSYAWRSSPHTGVDVGDAGIGGASVFAMRSGTVTFAGWRGCCHTGYGVTVIIDHGGGTSTLYAHMQAGSLAVSSGQFVEQGALVGRVGTTGHSTGNHLHYEVRINGTAVNPGNY